MPISPEAFTPGLSAPPSVFSLPLDPLNPAQLSTGSAYLYRMLHDSGEHSAPSDASAFNTTAHYLSDHVLPSAMRPDLWAPAVTGLRAPGFMTPAVPGPDSVGGDSAFELPGTPVSFQMRMSDLVVLTRSVMGAVAEGGLAPKTGTEGSSEAADAEAARSTAVVQGLPPISARAVFAREAVTKADDDVAMPDLVPSRGGTASGDESGDEEEVVTPCEEVQLDLGPHICSASPQHSASSIEGGLPEEDRDKGKAVEGTGESNRRGPR
ncbi:hypothetical protein BD413DRAFT_581621 [Trametes elegans]|nr:hypothetical protein BD413DRAFT_581621 [Trametes elegans]